MFDFLTSYLEVGKDFVAMVIWDLVSSSLDRQGVPGTPSPRWT